MVTIVGVDLAWSGRYESGICVWHTDGRDARSLEIGASVASAAELAHLCDHPGAQTVVVAVDAPLIVTGHRDVERDIGRAFGRHKAAAHSGSLALLQRTSRMAGPQLAEALVTRGFSLDPAGLLAGTPGRYAFETYPHAAHVRLFELQERIAYKRKRGRTVADARRGLTELQRRLAALLGATVPGVLEDAAVGQALARGAVDVRGKALKRLEDVLDGLTCAYVGWHAWRFGAAGTEVFGDEVRGCICVPRGPAAVPATSARAQTSP